MHHVCTRRRGREKLGQTRSRQSCLIGCLYEPNAMNVCVRISRNRRLVTAIDSQIAYFRREVTTFFYSCFSFFPRPLFYIIFLARRLMPLTNWQCTPHRRFVSPVNGSPLQKNFNEKKNVPSRPCR